MAAFGIVAIPTHYTIPPAELGRWAEAHGFDSLWFGEHSHIPTSRRSPFPLEGCGKTRRKKISAKSKRYYDRESAFWINVVRGQKHFFRNLLGGELPEYYKEFFDPFIGLTAAAAVTTKLKVGTSVCLVPEHNTINLAKTVACLDRVSNGRFLFGIGAGWNAEEMADHGVEFKDRWKVTRERILAMKEIWTKDVAEYHGKFVNFDPIWCWPKPVRAGGPPVYLGAWSKFVPKRVAEYCDGWMPVDAGIDLASGIEAVKAEAQRLERSTDAFDFSVLTAYELARTGGLEARIQELLKLGFNRVLFMAPVAQPDKQWPVLERYAALIRKFL